MRISLLALATIVFMRIFVFIASSTPSMLWIFQDRSYHVYYGILLIILGFFYKQSVNIRTLFLGVGFGLLFDDIAALTYLIIGPSTNPITDYWSPLFIIPLIMGMTLLLLFEFYREFAFPRLLDNAMSKPVLMRLRRTLLSHAEGQVLEIGFGTGLNASEYPSQVRTLTTVDINPKLSTLAQRRIRQSNLDVTHVVASAESLPFPNNMFDTIISTWTFCSIEQADRALDEIFRVLKPNGKLLFLEHTLSDQVSIQRWQRLLTPFWKQVTGGCHLDRHMKKIISGHHQFKIVDYREFDLQDVTPLIGHMQTGIVSKIA